MYTEILICDWFILHRYQVMEITPASQEDVRFLHKLMNNDDAVSQYLHPYSLN